jgi:hypothetical protein
MRLLGNFVTFLSFNWLSFLYSLTLDSFYPVSRSSDLRCPIALVKLWYC